MNIAVISTGTELLRGGTVTTTATEYAINSNYDVTINGGTVSATGKVGINAPRKVTINGGKVIATGQEYGIHCHSNDTTGMTIKGGNVIVTGGVSGIDTSKSITLGWTNVSDCIYVSSFMNLYEHVTVTMSLTDGENNYSGNTAAEALGGKTLRPYFGTSTAELTLVQGTKDGVSAWWGTFYPGGNNYVLSEGAAAYTMDASRHLYRLGTDGRTVPAGQAVVIIATEATPVSPATSPATATIPLYNIGNNTLAVTDHASGGNILQGSNSDVQVTDGQVNSQTPCVLSVVNGVVGFYPVANDYNGVIPANKAYYLTTP